MNPYSLLLKAPAFAGFFICAVLMLSGCATQQVSILHRAWPADLPAQTEIKGISFFPQEDYECGPASLAMLMQAAGVKVLPEQLLEQVYLPNRKGSLQVEMLVASRRHGLVSYALKPDLETILREVAAGNPVLILQNLSFSIYPIWHYAVVIGFDRDRNVMIMHSGRTPRLEMSLFTFERTWARSDYWAMLALPPERIPETAGVDAYAESIAALERINPGSAQIAYQAALKKWASHRVLMLGAGNTAYASGQLSDALSRYRALVETHPSFADGWNNLAQTLFELGQKQEASVAIARAISLGGTRLKQYYALQRQITGE